MTVIASRKVKEKGEGGFQGTAAAVIQMFDGSVWLD